MLSCLTSACALRNWWVRLIFEDGVLVILLLSPFSGQVFQPTLYWRPRAQFVAWCPRHRPNSIHGGPLEPSRWTCGLVGTIIGVGRRVGA
jgi:hypothetical protein